jgi:hypothetical protein
VLSGEESNTNVMVFGLNPRFTTLEASTMTITPLVRLVFEEKINLCEWEKIHCHWRNGYFVTVNQLETEYCKRLAL